MNTFTPKNAEWSRDQIWGFFYEKSERGGVLCWIDERKYSEPAFTPDEIPDYLCQQLVDEEFDLHQQGSDVEQVGYDQSELASNYFKKIKQALGR